MTVSLSPSPVKRPVEGPATPPDSACPEDNSHARSNTVPSSSPDPFLRAAKRTRSEGPADTPVSLSIERGDGITVLPPADQLRLALDRATRELRAEFEQRSKAESERMMQVMQVEVEQQVNERIEGIKTKVDERFTQLEELCALKLSEIKHDLTARLDRTNARIDQETGDIKAGLDARLEGFELRFANLGAMVRQELADRAEDTDGYLQDMLITMENECVDRTGRLGMEIDCRMTVLEDRMREVEREHLGVGDKTSTGGSRAPPIELSKGIKPIGPPYTPEPHTDPSPEIKSPSPRKSLSLPTSPTPRSSVSQNSAIEDGPLLDILDSRIKQLAADLTAHTKSLRLEMAAKFQASRVGRCRVRERDREELLLAKAVHVVRMKVDKTYEPKFGNIKVIRASGQKDLILRVREDTTVHELIEAVTRSIGAYSSHPKLLRNGKRLPGNETLKQLGIEFDEAVTFRLDGCTC